MPGGDMHDDHEGRLRVFFNRPGHPVPLAVLLDDMRGSTRRLAIASAWFTDRVVAQAFVDSAAPDKVAVLNAADLERGGIRAAALRLPRDQLLTLPGGNGPNPIPPEDWQALTPLWRELVEGPLAGELH